MLADYDAFLLVSFGGPEGMADVRPFLANVLKGRNVPEERMRAVERHYELFGGVSPINAQCRALIEALQADFALNQVDLPVYWGNRNWHPLLADTVSKMREAGVKKALAFVTSAFGSFASCRQYVDDIERARAEVGERAPAIDKLRLYYNHPGFIETYVQHLLAALDQLEPARRARASLVFTAHSIPAAMAAASPYEGQLAESCRLVAAGAGRDDWKLVYQSRSGAPGQPWLEPDICAYLKELKAGGVEDVVVVPIGFVSDHMEVVYDLDTEAAALARALGLNMVRASTAGVHPAFVGMIRDLVSERALCRTALALGGLPPPPHKCPPDCCAYVPAGPRPL